MNVLSILKITAIVLSIIVLIWFFIKHQQEKLNLAQKVKIFIIGLVSNFFDTIGIGSFATIIAMRSMMGVMPDEVKLIGSMNIQAMVTALVQAIIFLQVIPIDIKTLLIAVTMIALGGYLSGIIAVNVRRQLVHRVMIIAFIITGALLFLSQLNLLEINNQGNAITGVRLVIFAIFMLIAGCLPAFGVGYYSLVKASIFLFGVNPIIAFPIMASASAFQMPVTSLAFISKQKFYFKSTLIMIVSGVIGVFLAAPIISHVNTYTLKWILFVIVIYNIVTLIKASKKEQ